MIVAVCDVGPPLSATSPLDLESLGQIGYSESATTTTAATTTTTTASSSGSVWHFTKKSAQLHDRDLFPHSVSPINRWNWVFHCVADLSAEYVNIRVQCMCVCSARLSATSYQRWCDRKPLGIKALTAELGTEVWSRAKPRWRHKGCLFSAAFWLSSCRWASQR